MSKFAQQKLPQQYVFGCRSTKLFPFSVKKHISLEKLIKTDSKKFCFCSFMVKTLSNRR